MTRPTKPDFAKVLRKEGRDAFEEALRSCSPSSPPEHLERHLLETFQESDKVSPFPSPNERGGSNKKPWSVILGVAAAITILATLVFQNKVAPLASGQTRVAGTPSIQQAVPNSHDPTTAPATLKPIGFEREVIDVENIGYVNLEGGHPYQGYRFRTKDTQHWTAKPDPTTPADATPRTNSLHLSSERDNILYLPVTFH